MNPVVLKLHERALKVVENYKKSETELIEIFQELDENKGFLEFDCTSLFIYGVKILKLSEETVYPLITIARRAKKVPELKKAIEEGLITVSKASRIASVITPQNQEGWLDKAETLTKAKLEKEIAKENPKLAVTERARYVAEERLELKMGVSEKFMEKLKRVQDLESQRTARASSYEEALEAALEIYLERNDPLRKAARAKAKQGSQPQTPTKSQTQSQPQPESELGSGRANRPERLPIPAATTHALMSRDEGCCTYQSKDGQRCNERRWIQIHHIKPVSEGGQNNLANLTTLCSAHHRVEHR